MVQLTVCVCVCVCVCINFYYCTTTSHQNLFPTIVYLSKSHIMLILCYIVTSCYTVLHHATRCYTMLHRVTLNYILCVLADQISAEIDAQYGDGGQWQGYANQYEHEEWSDLWNIGSDGVGNGLLEIVKYETT